MSTKKEPAESNPEKPRRRPRPEAAKPDETPPPISSTPGETPPEAVPEAVAVLLRPETCVFCNAELQVDPDNLAGGKVITEPALGIRHFVCAGCGDA